MREGAGQLLRQQEDTAGAMAAGNRECCKAWHRVCTGQKDEAAPWPSWSTAKLAQSRRQQMPGFPRHVSC
jgi:hypothetical protein